MTLILINYVLDSAHPILANQSKVALDLCSYFDFVKVITFERSFMFCAPSNMEVHAIGKPSNGRLKLILLFYKTIYSTFKESIRSNSRIVVFSHMNDVLAFFASFVTCVMKIRHVFWYAHSHRSIFASMASCFVSEIVSSTFESCPYKNVRLIGQGIDSGDFRFVGTRPRNNLVHYGRLDLSKNVGEIVEVVDKYQYSHSLKLTLIGDLARRKETQSFRILEDKLKRSKEWLTWHSSVPRTSLNMELINQGTFIHAYRGSLDKTLIESVFLGLNVVTVNPSFIRIFGRWASQNSPLSLDIELNAFLSLADAQVEEVRSNRLQIASEMFEYSAWLARLVKEIYG